LQYTGNIKSSENLLKGGRYMTLVRARKQGASNINLSGSLVLDIPKIGWIQAGYDDYYGGSAGVGFNINNRISIGYTYEKGLKRVMQNLGPTHEISMAYSFHPKLTDKMVFSEDSKSPIDEFDEIKSDNAVTKIAEVPETQIIDPSENELSDNKKYKKFSKRESALLTAKNEEIAMLKIKIDENTAIIDELLYQQDSIEMVRTADMERRFMHIMKFIKKEASRNTITKNNLPYKAALNNTVLTRINASVLKTNSPIIKSNGLVTSNIKPIQINLVSETSKSPLNVVKEERHEGFNKAQKSVLFKDQTEIDKLFEISKQNNSLSQELIFKQDSLEQARHIYMEKRLKEMLSFAEKENRFKIVSNDDETSFVYAKDKDYKERAKKEKLSMNAKEDAVTINEGYTKEIKTKTETERLKNIENVANKAHNDFKEAIKKDNIKYSGTKRINGAESGYYLIANVYSKNLYFNKFLNSLKDKGFEAKYFINEKNKWKYVYLRRFNSWQEAVVSYSSKLIGTYHDDLWIMKIDNGDFKLDNLYDEENKALTQNGIKSEIKNSTVANNQDAKLKSLNENASKKAKSAHTDFKEVIKKDKIKYSGTKHIEGTESGYYLVANVYSKTLYFNKFLKSLNDKGFEVKYFINDANNWKYVYLRRFKTWQEAVASYKSKLNGSYQNDLWIMKIDNGDHILDYSYSTKHNKTSQKHNKFEETISK